MICVAAASSLGFTSSAYFRPPLVLVGHTFSWLLIPPLRITKKGYLSVTFFYYWSGQWDWRCRCVLARLSASPAYFRPPLGLVGPTFSWRLIPSLRITKKGLPFGNLLLLLERAMGFGPTTSTLATKKIIPKVAVMGILSRYFYGYWYVFAHRRHYQLWYRFQYILDFCTLYI